MKPEITQSKTSYMSVLLLICGGPIGKSTSKTAAQSDTGVVPINKKTNKSNSEQEKKSSYAVKTK